MRPLARPWSVAALVLAALVACDEEPVAPDALAPAPKEVCDNGLDDDADKKVDCLDPDCFSDPGCGAYEDCGNGADDDGDGKADCADSDCGSDPRCQQAAPEICGNGTDDDGDGKADCADSDCNGSGCGAGCLCSGSKKTETSCTDARDNDLDGDFDCLDSDCAGNAGCLGESCSNGADDDGDGLKDCADPDCAGKSCGSGCLCSGLARTEEACADLLDNDGDGAQDCADPDCAGKSCGTGCACSGSKKTETACTDAQDNDGDGALDCADPDCAGKSCGTGCACSGSKKTETACSDAQDNDGDGALDCADPDCAGAANCSGPQESCSNGTDDDGDRAVDCKDSGCAGNAACANLADGAPCASGSQCRGGLCLDEIGRGMPNGACSGTCANAGATCPGGGVCIFSSATSGYCRPKCACTGTFCSNNGGCRAGYACMEGRVNHNLTGSPEAFFCVAQCSADVQCVDRACNLWSNYCETDKGRKRTGQACAGDNDCESYFCLTAAEVGFPGGYCMSTCGSVDRVCGGDGACYLEAGQTDGLGYCYDGCTGSPQCRTAEQYTCQSFIEVGQICYPTCGPVGAPCGVSSDCCAGHACDGTKKVCL